MAAEPLLQAALGGTPCPLSPPREESASAKSKRRGGTTRGSRGVRRTSGRRPERPTPRTQGGRRRDTCLPGRLRPRRSVCSHTSTHTRSRGPTELSSSQPPPSAQAKPHARRALRLAIPHRLGTQLSRSHGDDKGKELLGRRGTERFLRGPGNRQQAEGRWQAPRPATGCPSEHGTHPPQHHSGERAGRASGRHADERAQAPPVTRETPIRPREKPPGTCGTGRVGTSTNARCW